MEEIVNAIESGKGELIGIACEKPLGRNVKEAKQMLALAKKVDLLDGYLENQVFAPSVTKGKEIFDFTHEIILIIIDCLFENNKN